MKPKLIPNIKDMIISFKVVNICLNNIPSLYNFIIVFIIRDGLEKIKLSIILNLVNNSHIIINI